MIFTKPRKFEDIENDLDINDSIAIIGCETCVRTAGSGGEEKMQELAMYLRKKGYNVVEGFMIPDVCTPKTYFAKPDKKVNTIISLSCSAGKSNIKRFFEDYKIVEAVTDIGLMATDSDKNILKVTMPYQDFENELGKEYDCFTGRKRKTDNDLPIMEVKK